MRDSLSDPGDRTKAALRVLFLEDQAADVDLSLRALRAADFEVQGDVAASPEEFAERVRSTPYDIILADYRMPGATGMDAFETLKAEGLNTPFILVTGSLGEEKAVECVKQGVSDYVLKDRLARLPVAVQRALEERRLREQRARAEDALRRSEASYRSLIQGAACGIFRSSPADGRFLEVNPALVEMLGYASEADLLALSPGEALYLDPEARARLLRGCAGHGRVRDLEVEWRRRDGTPITVRLSGRRVRDEQGVITSLEMIAENVTEKRRAEARIRQLNRLYSVLSHAGQAIVRIRDQSELFRRICSIAVEKGRFRMAWVGVVDARTRLVRPVAHAGFEEGYLDRIRISVSDEPAGRGPTGSALREGRHVVCDDIAVDPAFAPWREQALRRGYRSSGAFPLPVRGQTVGVLSICASEPGFFDAENVALLDELAADVSFALERMDLEQMRQRAVDELDQFFNLSLDMLCIAGLDGYIHRLNPAWEKTLGFTAEELRARFLGDFAHPEDRLEVLAACRTLRAGGEVRGLEARFLCKDRSYRWLITDAIPVPQQGVFFAAVRDVTDRRRLEEQLRRKNRELEEQNRQVQAASRMKSEFLANMSHELRSPLNGIIGFSELLYDGRLGLLPERQKDFVGRILNSSHHLLRLINDVLDLAKIETGRLELQPERLSLPGLIQEVTGILGSLAAEKRIRMESEIDAEVADVVADPARLKQVLYNYVSNAIKFTGDGGRVVVRLKPEGAAGFRLEVSDTGVGIPQKDLARLFVEFQQLDASTAKRYQGTGLGLALTKRIVEGQGGRVGVESTPGQGSTFFAVLPRVVRPGQGRAPQILIVEDDAVERLELASILQREGYRVETAQTHAEALVLCRRLPFDAIALDILLPDSGGWQTLEAIRATVLNSRTPVIVISVIEEKDLVLPPDVQALLAKPVGRNQLLAALEQAGAAPRAAEAAHG